MQEAASALHSVLHQCSTLYAVPRSALVYHGAGESVFIIIASTCARLGTPCGLRPVPAGHFQEGSRHLTCDLFVVVAVAVVVVVAVAVAVVVVVVVIVAAVVG